MGVTIQVINKKKLCEPQMIEQCDFVNYKEMCSYLGFFNLIKKLDLVLAPSSELPLFIGNCEFLNINYLFNYLLRTTSMSVKLNESIFAGGKGFTIYKAICSSLGEAFERLMACLEYFERRDQLILGTYRELNGRGLQAIHPSQINLFSDDQFKQEDFLFDEFTEDTTISWIKMRDYNTGEDRYAPACLLMMYHRPVDKNEKRIGYGTSGGLTSHFHEKNGTEHGLQEIIERHEINLSWYCKIRPQEIVIDDIQNRTLDRYINYIKEKNVRFFRHNVDQQHFHVVTAMSFDKDMTKYSFNAGGGVDSNIEKAILAAMEEYTQAVNNTRKIVYAPSWITSIWSHRVLDVNEDDNPRDFKTFYQAVSYYGLERYREKLDWFVCDNEKVLLSEVRNNQPDIGIDKYIDDRGLQPIIDRLSIGDRFKNIYITKVFMAEFTPAFIAGVPSHGHPKYKEYLGDNKLNEDILPFP